MLMQFCNTLKIAIFSDPYSLDIGDYRKKIFLTLPHLILETYIFSDSHILDTGDNEYGKK